jgi:diguanylate cyclase (GGDEF)-like protein
VVNDSVGHTQGDHLLVQVAQRIKRAVHADDVVGRLGGDEFLIICPGVSRPHEALSIAQHVLASMRQPIDIVGRTHSLTGSIGVALSTADDTTPTAARLIERADIAMYRAKRDGRRQAVLFDESMRVEARIRLDLEGELKLALERNEFVLHFQPLVYFGRSIVQNFEALIRWNHPRHGLIPPGDFLPLVEQVGLTGAVGRWVFAAAIRSLAALREIDPECCIGVNVHPDQIRQPGFVEGITRNLEAFDLDGEGLAIEITEHAVMTDVERTRVVLEELRRRGVSVAIDDFGTGYSNLDLLRRLPVDFLKIDRSFVSGLGEDPGDAQLVRMILGLAEELGIKVVAEGIETELQASMLDRLGCTIGQGYFFARPMPLEAALDILRGQQARPPSNDRIVPVMNRAVSEAM